MADDSFSESFLSVRIVTIDHYMAAPITDVDVVYNVQRAAPVKKVPVLRIFGPTAAGQKACLNVHGIFPYIYVPKPKNAPDGFDHQLMSSLDKALNLSMGVLESRTQHVYKCEDVSGIPFYGYHPRQHRFLKLYLYNPMLVKRAAEMLLNGAVMEKHLQPHESHVPFTLQFLMDYNLQGMNFIHLSDAKFRRKTPEESEVKNEEEILSTSQGSDDDDSWFNPSQPMLHPSQRMFNLDEMSAARLLPEDVVRESPCELECDAVAADIINCNESCADSSSLEQAAGGMNPGLQAIWEDERERRRLLDIDEPLTPPSSPPRPAASTDMTESEQFWKQRFLEQLDKMQAEERDRGTPSSLSTSSSADPNATCNLTLSLDKERVYAEETSPYDADLQSASFVQTHLPTLSRVRSSESQRASLSRKASADCDMFADDSNPYLDETIVDEEVALSQSLSLLASQKSALVLGEDDQELIEMLAEMGQNREDKKDGDIVEALSQLSTKKSEEEEKETLEMSQIISYDDIQSDDESPKPGPSKETEKNQPDPDATLWGDEEFWNNLDVDQFL